MNLSVRSTLSEIMDNEDIDEVTYQRCLADLASVNRVTFTHRPTLRWLARATKSLPAGTKFSVLDVAYAENARLRRAVSDLTLEKLVLKEVASGKF